ncbi:MAG: trigger factor [Lachnospiraceae bacterium]|jgi:trigger factor|nr:trigger factor [Lachnospiraceae bacterium]MEE3461079.1 trigger factor [Lachnospiraceae bacterium]
MSVKVDNLEKSTVKLTIEVGLDKFDEAVKKVYSKQKNRIQVPGFRKGKAPLKMVEQYYGKEVFFEDAANEVIPDAYEDALKEADIKAVSRPTIGVDQLVADKPFIFTATVAVKPEVELGDYKGVEVGVEQPEVTDDELSAELDREREKEARFIDVDDRPVQMDDEADIDFEGFVDGVPFEGGKGTNYKLRIGSHSFIDNFEDQIIGHKIGDEFDVFVTFPENYQEKSLEGKAAVFKVKVNGIKVKELPELDDDFAQDISDFDTLDAYKDDLKSKLLDQKKEAIKREKEEAVLAKIVENSKMEISDLMVDSQVEQMKQEFEARIRQQGLSLSQYMQFTGLSMEQLDKDIRPQALTRIQSRLVLEKIVEAENIEASDDEVNEEIKKIAEAYKTDVDNMKKMLGEEELQSLKEDVKVQKAADFVVENAKEVEKKADDKKDDKKED